MPSQNSNPAHGFGRPGDNSYVACAGTFHQALGVRCHRSSTFLPMLPNYRTGVSTRSGGTWSHPMRSDEGRNLELRLVPIEKIARRSNRLANHTAVNPAPARTTTEKVAPGSDGPPEKPGTAPACPQIVCCASRCASSAQQRLIPHQSESQQCGFSIRPR